MLVVDVVGIRRERVEICKQVGVKPAVNFQATFVGFFKRERQRIERRAAGLSTRSRAVRLAICNTHRRDRESEQSAY